ncbi:chemotaxis protein CheB [Nitrospira sp. Nam80]
MKKVSAKKGPVVADPLRRVKPPTQDHPRYSRVNNLIVIGTSAGGHHALKEVVRGLSDDIPAAIIIMQHMPRTQRQGPFKLGDWLQESTRMPIVAVEGGESIREGTLYISPPGTAVTFEALHLAACESKPGAPTTINELFHSAAQHYGDRVIGVVLTGLLKDGTAGLKSIHDVGGVTIVQDPVEAEYPDMPASAMKDLPVTFCLRLREIGPTLDLLARRMTGLETGLAVSVRMLKERVGLLMQLIKQSQRNPRTLKYLTTELTALELDLRTVQNLVDKALRDSLPIEKRSSGVERTGRVLG